MATNQEIAALAVSLSLDSGNFSKAMSSIDKAIRNLDKDFQNAGRGIENFETTMEGLGKKLETTQAKIKLYNDKLEAQKKAHESLQQTFDRQKAKLDEIEATLGRGSAEWQKQSELVARNAQKLSALNTNIGATEGNLRELNGALERTQTALNEAGNNATEAGNKLKAMAEKAQAAGEKTKEIGESLKSAGEAAAPASTAMAAIGGASILAFKQVDDGLAKIKISLGQTGDEAKLTQNRVQEMAQKGFDFNEATDAIINVQKNLGDLLNPKQVDSLAETFQVLAKQDLGDVEEMTKAANSAMRNFGIEGGKAGDVITAGLQSPLNVGGEFLDTINEYSPQFAAMGFNIDQSMAIMNAGMKDGAFSLDKLVDGVKEFGLRTRDIGKPQAAALEKLGLSTDEVSSAMSKGGEAGAQMGVKIATALSGVKNESDRNAMAVALFGTQYEDVRDQAYKALTGIADNTIKTAGAADAAKKAYEDTFGARMQAVIAKMQPSLLKVAEALVPLIEKLADVAVKAANWFTGLDSGSQKAIMIFGAIVAAMGPVLMIVGQMTLGFGTLITGVGKIIPIFAKLGPLFTRIGSLFGILRTAAIAVGTAIAGISAPVWIVIGVVAALVVAGVALYKHWDTVKVYAAQFGAFLAQKWQEIKKWTVDAFNGIVDFFKKWGPTMLVVISGPIGWIVAAVVKNWDAIKTATSKAWNAVKTAISTVWSGIKTAVSTYINAVKTNITTVWNAIKSVSTTVWNAIKSTISTVWNSIKSVISSAINGIKSSVSTGFNAVKSTATSVMNNIKSAVSSVWNSLKSVVSKAANGIRSAVSSAFSGLKSIMTAPFTAAMSVISGIIGKIKSAVSGVKSIGSKLGSMFSVEAPTIVANPTAPTVPTAGISAMGAKGTAPTMSAYTTGGGILQSFASLQSTMSDLDFSSDKYNAQSTKIGAKKSNSNDSALANEMKDLKNMFAQMLTVMSAGQNISVQVGEREIIKAIKSGMDIALNKNTTSRKRARGGN